MTAQPNGLVRTFDVDETGRRQPGGQTRRVDRVVGVALVVGLQLVAGQAVAGHQRRAGPQHAGDLREQPILEFVRRDVMQHGEARRAGEPVVGIGERRRVAVHDLHRRNLGEAVDQHRRELVVDLDRREPRHRLAQNVGGGAVSGSDLEHVVAEVDVTQRPRKDDVSDHLPPFVAAAVLVRFVHDRSI